MATQAAELALALNSASRRKLPICFSPTLVRRHSLRRLRKRRANNDTVTAWPGIPAHHRYTASRNVHKVAAGREIQFFICLRGTGR
jgi:hypothetical protein